MRNAALAWEAPAKISLALSLLSYDRMENGRSTADVAAAGVAEGGDGPPVRTKGIGPGRLWTWIVWVLVLPQGPEAADPCNPKGINNEKYIFRTQQNTSAYIYACTFLRDST